MSVWLTLLLFCVSGAAAETEGLLNKLLAPGPLIEGHQKLEGVDCFKCHKAGKGIEIEKCVECHKELRPHVETKRGYHGRTDKSCVECHLDHKGRSYDSTLVDEKKFNHLASGFELLGGHAKIKCEKCHLERRAKKPIRSDEIRYFGKTSSCESCHKKKDPHFFVGKWAKLDCKECHGVSDWKKQVRFDHLKDGGYRLEEKHAEVSCKKCHIPVKNKPAIYRWADLKDERCVSCHESVHRVALSERYQNGRCDVCHTQTKWTIESFKHSITQYELTGAHEKTTCLKCHQQSKALLAAGKKKGYRWNGLERKCIACHKNPHPVGATSLFAKKTCTDCHTTENWKKMIGPSGQGKNFDHKETRFRLTGKHIPVKCTKCHQSGPKQVYAFAERDKQFCVSCHPNVHVKQFDTRFAARSCADCHSTDNFVKRAPLDHNSTGFKLLGKHFPLTCEKCHKLTDLLFPPPSKNRLSRFLFPGVEEGECASCHKDPHLGKYSQSCSECHVERGWKITRDFHKDFALGGVHYALQCTECHERDRKLAGVGAECVLCHQKDDVHGGALSECGTCHRQQFWENADFKHSLTQFALRGIHRTLECAECHRGGIYRGAPTECQSCHMSEAQAVNSPAHVMPSFERCDQCHNHFVF